jgi:ribonuclease P protein component
MLPRVERLSTTEFAEVFENGRVLRHPLLQLRVVRRASDGKANGHSPVRAAFVVPKKLGKATLRNRLRRRVRERYRLGRTTGFLPLALAGCDLIWMIGSPAVTASGAELDGALRELLRRAAIQTGKNRS